MRESFGPSPDDSLFKNLYRTDAIYSGPIYSCPHILSCLFLTMHFQRGFVRTEPSDVGQTEDGDAECRSARRDASCLGHEIRENGG